MNDKDRDTLRRHWRSLRRDLEPVKLLPCLVDVLDATDEETVKAQSTRADKVDKLLDILRRRGPRAFVVFVNALQEVQPFLASHFLQGSEESGRNEERLTKIEVNECPEVVRLRETVLAVAQQLPQMKEAIPLKWLQYKNELQLLREEDKKWIPISEARQIASDKCGIDDDEQFWTLLDFLHDQRVLIHFYETPQRNMVILDPQWLIDVFKKVITIKQYEHTQGNDEELWLKLETTGILDERLLDHEWKPLFDMYSEGTRRSLIAIMERLSLLCLWPSDDGANKQYLVPSILMSPPTDQVKEVLASLRIPSLFVRFESGQVPPGLFSRLIVVFYQLSNEDWNSQITPELFNNFALFNIRPDQGTSVIFLCHSSSIEIAFHDGSNSLDAEGAGYSTSRRIHWQLRMILENMRKEFGSLKNMRYEMCVCCPVCPQKGSVICRTHDVRACECLHLLSESELQNCQFLCTKRGLFVDRRISIKKFAPWFTFSGSQEGKILTNRQAATGDGSYVEERSSSVSCKEGTEGKSLSLPDGVLQTIQSQSSDCKDIVAQFQECLQLTDPAALRNPEPETKRWIRCLASTAKAQNRTDLVEYLRTITPPGTTGPLLDEKLDFRRVPFKLRKDFTLSLSSGDEWKIFAEKLGMSYNEVRFLDKRTINPCDVVLDVMVNHRFMSVGEVYDQLVKSGLPRSADLL